MIIRSILVFLTLLCTNLDAQVLLKGTVYANDSLETMPFVMVLNKTSGQGCMSNSDGSFQLPAAPNDTLLFSYVGYARQKVAAKSLRTNRFGFIAIYMQPLAYDLRPVVIQSFKLKDYEREYMNDIIDRSRIRPINVIQSPITALYMAYSKEGRQIRKLAEIFNKILIEEAVEKKLNKQILTNLTGDDHIDFEAFRKYCYYLTDEYISSHEGVELYNKVMDCYQSYKKEMRPRSSNSD